MRLARDLVLIGLLAAFMVAAISTGGVETAPIAEAVVAEGVSATGAQNLVAAIYLGFRAFDTLGEAVVLLSAVSGVVILARRRP